MSRRDRYLLELQRDKDGRIGAVVLTCRSFDEVKRVVRANGTVLPRVVSPLHDVLRSGGVTTRQWASNRPIELDQITGGHARLLLSAVRPVRRAARIEQIAEGIAHMSREEAGYWYAKLHRRGGLAALRTLLASPR